MSSPINPKLRKKYYNLCNPNEALSPEDERYFNVDAQMADARGRDLIDTMATRIELSDEPILELFTGLPGSGKSTELKRLAQRLELAEGANLLTVHIDARTVLDVGSPIDIPDVLVAILHKTEAAVLEAEGKNPADALQAGPFTRLWDWLSGTDVELTGLNVGLSAGARVEGVGEVKADAAKAAIDLKTHEPLRDKVRKKVNEQMTTFRKAVEDYLGALNDRAKKKKRAGICVIFDNLEKLRGSSTNWTNVLDSAERMFRDGAPYLALPVHVIYTLPPALVLRLSAPIRFLPMLKITDRKGKKAAGFFAAWKLVERRIPTEHLQEIFGPTSYKDRIDRLIQWSGGYPREIVRLLQEMIGAAPFGNDNTKFNRILGDASDAYRRTITTNALPWLAQVYVDKQAAATDAKHREIVDEAFQNNVILRYQNDDSWEDLHPALHEMEPIKLEVEKLKKQRKDPTS